MAHLTRRHLVTGFAACLTAGIVFAGNAFAPLPAHADKSTDLENAILHDPDAPVGGNPKGDLTIVGFTDYNCPYCKKSDPILEKVVKEDGGIRLVYKEWPVIRPTSMAGAELALAAKYQGKYMTAHEALMAIPGSDVKVETMRAALDKAGIDMKKLDADMKTHQKAIGDHIQRTMDQADAIGLQGTPTYLIGPFRTGPLDYANFKDAIVDARKEQAKGK